MQAQRYTVRDVTIPNDVYHVVFGGSLPSGEIWESGFWVEGDAPTSNDLANATAQLWAAQLQAADTSGAMRITLTHCQASVTFDYVRVYSYPAGGPHAAYIGYHAASIAGTTSDTSVLPNQICLVVSLRTNNAGRSNRGRMYMPLNGINLQPNAQLNQAACTAIANGWATCFSDWNASGDNGQVVVMSRVGAGHTNVVSEVIVDSIPDTQRKRRNKVAAAFVQTAVVTV